MARIDRPANWVRETLVEAMAGSDRDKSDAGRAIVELAAVYLERDAYRSVVATLADSTYKHFREAAAGAEQDSIVERLRGSRWSATWGTALAEWALDDLHDETRQLARTLMGSGQHRGEARRIGQIGLELFARTRAGTVLQERPAVEG